MTKLGRRGRDCTPEGPSRTLEAKKGSSVTCDCTKVGSTTLASPFRPRRHASANSAPAYAIDSVAEPCGAADHNQTLMNSDTEGRDTRHQHHRF